MAHLYNKRQNIKREVEKEKRKQSLKNDNLNNKDDFDSDFDDGFDDSFNDFDDEKFENQQEKDFDNQDKDLKEEKSLDNLFDDEEQLENNNDSQQSQKTNHSIRKDLRNFNKKVKQKRKNKSSLMKTTILVGILLVLLVPIMLFMVVQSYAVVGSVTAISATVDPKSRAELIAKGELDPNQEATKVPKDILGAEFQDFNADDSSNSKSSSSNKKDNNDDTTANGTSDTRKKIIELAKSRVEKKIPYSQTNPQNWDDHLDCSGLVQETFKRAGINLTRTTYTQIKECDKIDKKDAKAGDLCFFIENGSPEHVAIYEGNDKFIEEPQPGQTAHEIKVYNMPGATQYWARPKALKDK